MSRLRRGPHGGILDDAGFEHGTRRGYTKFDCRCDSCRSAMTTYAKALAIDKALGLATRSRSTPADDAPAT